jgi:hypothetical protein
MKMKLNMRRIEFVFPLSMDLNFGVRNGSRRLLQTEIDGRVED